MKERWSVTVMQLSSRNILVLLRLKRANCRAIFLAKSKWSSIRRMAWLQILMKVIKDRYSCLHSSNLSWSNIRSLTMHIDPVDAVVISICRTERPDRPSRGALLLRIKQLPMNHRSLRMCTLLVAQEQCRKLKPPKLLPKSSQNMPNCD